MNTTKATHALNYLYTNGGSVHLTQYMDQDAASLNEDNGSENGSNLKDDKKTDDPKTDIPSVPKEVSPAKTATAMTGT